MSFSSALKLYLVAFLLLVSCFSASAELNSIGSGKISGRITDAGNGKPVEYASISLITQTDNKVINGTTSDNKGNFKLNDVPEGTYKLQIFFIGYQSVTKENIVVSKANANVAVGDIKISDKQSTLKEVTISTEKSLIENKIDKMVYNAEQDISSQSGVAADILKKVPQVSVDVDGNVELQGTSNVKFLINGKPSVLFGSNVAEVLQSIPASQIKSIEVITSPGAKYQAEGTGGIINIILKKSTAEGINGNVSLSAGTRLENGSVNLNAHHKHLSVNTFFSGNGQLTSKTLTSTNRQSQDATTGQTASLMQNGNSDFNRAGFESGIGFDWELSAKDNISGTFGYDYFGNHNNGFSNRHSVSYDVTDSSIFDLQDLVNTTNNYHENVYDYDLTYKHKFRKEDQELEISYNSSVGSGLGYYMQSQSYIDPEIIYNGSYGNNPGLEKETNITADYVQPIAEDFTVETGVRATLADIKSTSDVYLLNTATGNYDYSNNQSLSLSYKSNVYAYYLSTSFKLLKMLDVKAGGRYEYTDINAYYSNSGNANINPYSTYVPSLAVSYSFKNHQTVKINYSHRIERPDYGDLNPFINASDPKNITTGNSGLRPETGDKIELSYSKNFEKGTSVVVTAFYRGNKNDIQGYTRFFPTYKVGDSTYTNVSVNTRENIGRENNYGFNLFVSVPASSKISLRSNFAGYQRYIINGAALPGSNVQGFNYRANVNASYQMLPTLAFELFGNFRSASTRAQGTTPAVANYNFAVRKQFFNKKASIALTATNFFDKYVEQKTILNGVNFQSNNMRELPYRSFGVNVTYKFGKLAFKKEHEAEDVNLTNQPGAN